MKEAESWCLLEDIGCKFYRLAHIIGIVCTQDEPGLRMIYCNRKLIVIKRCVGKMTHECLNLQ